MHLYIGFCFTTTWDYTTLKHKEMLMKRLEGFTTTWDYTTLKLLPPLLLFMGSFTTTWDYTTLKLLLVARIV